MARELGGTIVEESKLSTLPNIGITLPRIRTSSSSSIWKYGSALSSCFSSKAILCRIIQHLKFFLPWCLWSSCVLEDPKRATFFVKRLQISLNAHYFYFDSIFYLSVIVSSTLCKNHGHFGYTLSIRKYGPLPFCLSILNSILEKYLPLEML